MQKRWLVLIVVLGLGWWFWGRSLEPVGVIRAQLEAIKNGNFDDAYRYLTVAARAQVMPGQFEEQARNNSVVSRTLDSTFLYRNMGQDIATIRGELLGEDGQRCDAEYQLIKVGDVWKIASF